MSDLIDRIQTLGTLSVPFFGSWCGRFWNTMLLSCVAPEELTFLQQHSPRLCDRAGEFSG